jgi:hypothetical protein
MNKKYSINKRQFDGLFQVSEWRLDPQADELRKEYKQKYLNRPIPDYLKFYRWVTVGVLQSRFKAVQFIEGLKGNE